MKKITYTLLLKYSATVTNTVNHLLQESLSPVIAGKLFEQWLMNEVRAFLSYRESDTEMYYPRFFNRIRPGPKNGRMPGNRTLSKGQHPHCAMAKVFGKIMERGYRLKNWLFKFKYVKKMTYGGMILPTRLFCSQQ